MPAATSQAFKVPKDLRDPKIQKFKIKKKNMTENQEKEYSGLLVNGFAMIFFIFILLPVAMVALATAGGEENLWLSVGCNVPLAIIFILGLCGYFTQEPGEARVMIFFGKYVGTCRKVGYFWTNPFITRRKLSLRLRNMDIDPIKVNDKIGNPVLIGMVLVWKSETPTGPYSILIPPHSGRPAAV